MEYSTYWSILDTPSKSIQSNSIFLYVTIIAGILWLLARKYERDKGDKKLVLWATGTFALLGLVGYVLLSFIYQDDSNEKTLKMLNSSTTPRVEGVVSNFQRTYRNTKLGNETIETFTVDSVQFAYGNAALGKFNSFNRTNNDIIFDGQKVRITYSYGSVYCDECNSILKLEIPN